MTPFKVVMPSGNDGTLSDCVQSILDNEPALTLQDIVIIDDGISADLRNQLKGAYWIRGEQPFNFSRSVNAGIQATTGDVVVMNDDSILETYMGLSMLSTAVTTRQDIGIMSPGITGRVGPLQQRFRAGALRFADDMVAFICVYIPRRIIDEVGLLDERFVGYGYDDRDYCRRVRMAGYKIAVWDSCKVAHVDGAGVYINDPNLGDMVRQGKLIYEEKWAN